MWEQIRSNRRKSFVLVFVMAALLIGLGYAIGEAIAYQAGFTGAGFVGLGVALIIWLIMTLVTFAAGDKIMLAVSHARPIEKQDHPQLYNVVEEMTIAAGLGKMPAIYVIDDMALNAFATGRNPDKSAVAVTAGLLSKLDRDQLQGVIAHEMSHVINRDVLFMTVLGIMMGAIVMISEIFLRSLWYSGGRRSRRYRSSKSSGQAQLIIMLAAIVLAILAPFLAQLIYLASSRRREYLADANAAVLTRYPAGLAGALEAIAGDTAKLSVANRATAPMYIANPFKKLSASAGLFSTHPPIAERIRILRSMGGAVSYADYQQAWNKVDGKSAGSLPQSALRGSKSQPVREAHPDAGRMDTRQRVRQAGDVLRKVNKFFFLPCACGLRIKLPPDFKQDRVTCPRCHRELAVPVAQLAAVGAVADTLTGEPPARGAPGTPSAAEAPPLQITRHGQGWQSFKCDCGNTLTLSPSFRANQVRCSKCGKAIGVKQA